MLRSKFQQELESLNKELVDMCAVVEKAINDSVKALITQDKSLCNEVIVSDKQINRLTAKVESKAHRILLTQQPVASDLRTISTAMKIVNDLERIGDQASDISGIVIHLCEEEYQETLKILPKMGDLAIQMVHECVESFVEGNLETAQKVIQTDDEMDKLFAALRDESIDFIKTKKDYANQGIYFMMIGKYFEKIGDHAENIAQWVIFEKSGEFKNQRLF
ncbi:MAG: phosphate signaling complex protein PhoU [Firmicutes bacterium]|nr:phosphate signaling complex protein PhoU [Bacillota bacterium]